MKRFTFLTMAVTFVFAAIIMVSCTKEGPAGATGPKGPQGPAGEDGINGTDGTAGCIECHDGGTTQGMFAITVQWEESVHSQGPNINRNYSECATCHTSQGYRENLETMANSANVANPNPVNCYTCHNIHETYTPADLGLTKSDALVTKMNGATIDFGKSNACVYCHQGRSVGDLEIDGDPITPTNQYWSAHYAPQANLLYGVGGGAFEFPGDATYGTSPHMNIVEEGCITCHMAKVTGPIGNMAGGHTMKMNYDRYGSPALNDAGCTSCHSDAAELKTKMTDLKTEVETLMAELEALLVAEGLILAGDDNIIVQEWPANLAAAFVNWKLVLKDHSYGVHNPTYIKALLENTIDAIKPAP